MISIDPPRETRLAGTVLDRSGRAHRIRLDSGRVVVADSAAPWPVGRRVVVVGGVIVGVGGVAPVVAEYQE